MSDPADPPLLDRRYLDDYAALLPREQLRRLVDTFMRELMSRPATVLCLARQGDIPAARAAAHLLRGAALSVGGSRIAALAGAVEEAGAEDVTTSAEALLPCAVATLAELTGLDDRVVGSAVFSSRD